jgi:hypothetical protein
LEIDFEPMFDHFKGVQQKWDLLKI